MKVSCNKNKPLLAGAITAEIAKTIQNVPISIEWGSDSVVSVCTESIPYETNNEIARFIARKLAEAALYGNSALEKTEVDSWLTFSTGPLNSSKEFLSAVQYLNKVLEPLTYLVGKRATIADFVVFSVLYSSKQWNDLKNKNTSAKNVLRWFNFIKSQDAVKKVLDSLPPEAVSVLESQIGSNQSTEKMKQEGKFVDLPEAEMGKVVVRFPPEASGYLHIGHAKAALLNQYYQQAFEGKLIMRFDDTNPAKENVHFEKVILEDVEMLEIKPDLFTHTSQYFDLMLEYCEKLLKEGKAYVDDTDPELMKQQREQKIESVNRNNTYEKNSQLWQEMKKGTEKGQQCCVRAKIDMSSPNGCLRDPTIYRCKNEPHPRTGDKYKVYPTYDFACPIVDAIEGVTHTLRTMEYHDRDPQFYWFIEALGLRKPYIWEYSRLSMTNTVLSKRKLTWFVSEKLVDGWDDPRFPTVRGVLRRGMTVEGLRQFIIAQGSSRSVVFMEWDKIWAFNKKVIDPIAPRFTALESDNPVPVNVKGVEEEVLSVPKHPKNADVGLKEVWIGPRILIDRVDAEQLKENENATFINWGNILIKKINRENGKIASIDAEANLDNKDYKKTLKLTWLADTKKAPFTPTYCVYFDHIISKPLLGKDEDFKQFINKDTRREVKMLGDPELRKIKKGDIIQLQRRGFFRVDVAYEGLNLHTGKETPAVLFYVPDGSAKDTQIVNNAAKQTTKAKTGNSSKTLTETSLTDDSKTQIQLNEDIVRQGDKVRTLKAEKANKEEIDAAVKALLGLKNQYKALTNTDWKPGCVPASVKANAMSESGDAGDICNKIAAQGDKVRQLKSEKASKAAIDAEVKVLLGLKEDYKKLTGENWTPNSAPNVTNNDKKQSALASENTRVLSESGDAGDLFNKTAAQGDKVRQLKSEKASKAAIETEVKVLLGLKEDYKKLTGENWTPSSSTNVETVCKKQSSAPANDKVLSDKITLQGERVRILKSEKIDKSIVDAEVKTLLALKRDFKVATGREWKPEVATKQTESKQNQTSGVLKNDEVINALVANITEQGNTVRNLKSINAQLDLINSAVKQLLDLKTKYKELTGADYVAPNQKRVKEKKPQQKAAPKPKKTVDADKEDGGLKKQTRLGLETRKEDNLSEWYSEVITKGELIEYYDVSGCYILRPWAFAVWESIQSWFDAEIKKLGIKNCYFPIFVSRSVLEKEKTHIADFAPEVAWVTKSGDSDLAEPIAVRPTSETVMYPAYAKWIRSYRDLPIKLNQWNNVVRWEFKHPQPFIRTREFLWQEGHTAYALKQEADEEVRTILDLYARIYTDLLAIPVVKGKKTEKEKFAGGDYTLTTEAFISASGRGIQGATSHHLGQNFSKMFEIVYEDPKTREKEFVYQNSWGITTRTIGVMILVHADNQGLVLPPRIASIQIILVPCGVTVGLTEADHERLQNACTSLETDLINAGVRVEGDYRMNYSPGWKFNHWELKGVPIRVEIGPKDIEKKQLIAVRRDTGEKILIPRDSAVQTLKHLLDEIQNNLYIRAENELKSCTTVVKDWGSFSPTLEQKKIILSPFCGDMSCEDKIKADSARDDEEADPGAPSMGAKSLCIPLEQPAAITNADRCIHPDCRNRPLYYTLFGRSY